jgi:hypothetical protein
MRVFKFLVTSFLIIAVIAVFVGFLGREALLIWGSSSLRSSLTVLQRVSRDNLQYARQCREKGGVTLDLATIAAVQLRFINDRDYVLEVVCSQFVSDPLLIERFSLPPLVNKKAGSGGIIWGNERSVVEIETFGRGNIIGVENEEIKSYGSGSVSLGIAPQTTCEGYGYQCCQQETFSGVGATFNGVSDCPKSCYSACHPRPVILSLNADPFPDANRHVIASAGETVTFTFVSSYEDSKQDKVITTLDFGDGQQQTFTTLSGRTTHQYSCSTGNCSYVVQVLARTASGVESVTTPITKLTVSIQ